MQVPSAKVRTLNNTTQPDNFFLLHIVVYNNEQQNSYHTDHNTSDKVLRNSLCWNIDFIDHCTVSVAILDVGQSRQKLQ